MRGVAITDRRDSGISYPLPAAITQFIPKDSMSMPVAIWLIIALTIQDKLETSQSNKKKVEGNPEQKGELKKEVETRR